MQLNYNNFLSIEDKNKKIHIDQSKSHSLEIDSFITHSHSDHLASTIQNTFASKETISLIREVSNKLRPGGITNFTEINYGKKIKINDTLTITPHNAGHILGSTMFFIEDEAAGKTILYTGDFNSSDSLFLKGAEPINADILIMESTFGKPGFLFGDREEIYNNLSQSIKRDIDNNKFVLIGGYTLGKNQELIYLLNKYVNEKPIVDKDTFNYSKVYEKNDIFLGQYELLDHNLLDNNILLLPMNLISKDLINSLSHQLAREVSSYIATGWNYNRSSKVYHLSDHCDYPSLLKFVQEVNPREVFTMHGFKDELAKGIQQKLNKPARSINEISQRGIFDF